MRQYIGARYVPKFMGTYDATQIYEALSVVDNGFGTSYISKVPTPANTPLTDTNYWAIYGASSGAIINLQNQIDNIENNEIPGINSDIQDVDNKVIDLYDVNVLNGKKILIIGDSLSDPNVGLAGTTPVWSEYFQTALSGVASVTIKAQSGMQMVDCPTFLTSITDWDYDIVLVFLGTNDFASSVQMGDYLGNDNTKFCDALKATYIYIRDHIMSATGHKEDIYFITPLYGRTGQNTLKMPQWFYSASIVGFCKRWGCKWINGYTFPMQGELYTDWTLVDSVHPTTAYAKIMSEYILGKLLSGGDIVSYNNDALYTDLSSLLINGATGTLKASFENEYLDLHFAIEYTPTSTNVQVADIFPFDISDLIDGNLFAPCLTFSGDNGVVMGMLYRNTDNSINANVPLPTVNVLTKLRCHFRIQPKWANMERSN